MFPLVLATCLLSLGLVNGVVVRIAVLHDHELSDIVINSVNLFDRLLVKDGAVTVEAVEFNLATKPDIYDELLGYNLSAVIVAARKLKCDKLTKVKKRIPIYVVTGSDKSCDEYDNENSLFYLYPPDSTVLNAMLLATEKYEWRKAMVMGENYAEFDFTFTSMQQARERGMETIAQKVTTDKETLHATIMTAKSEGIRSFILMGRMDHVGAVLTVAEELEITNSNFHWFIPNVFVTSESVKEFVSRGIKISLLYSPIITPLVYGMQAKQNENDTETLLLKEVVSSLTLLAVRATVLACENAGTGACAATTKGNYTCKTKLEDVRDALVSATATSFLQSATTTKEPSTASQNVTAVSTTEATTASSMMHGHMKRSVAALEREPANETSCEGCEQKKKNFITGSCLSSHCSPTNKKRIPVSVVFSKSEENMEGNLHRSKRAAASNISQSPAQAFYETPNSACLSYRWDETILLVASAVVAFSSGDGYDFENATMDIETSQINPQIAQNIATRIDTCLFTSNHTWNYGNDSCSFELVRNSEVSFANSLYVVEYPRTYETTDSESDSTQVQPLIVGAYNGDTHSYIRSTYSALHVYDVYLPERDLLVGAIRHPPWLDWEEDMNGELVFNGHLYDILERLSVSMNFSYQLLTEYNFVGDILNEDEVETYMLRVLQNHSVDFFLHTKSIRGNRLGQSNTVSLSASLQDPRMYLLTKRVEKTESVSIWQFMLPFREESWVCFWGSFILVSLLMTYYNKKNPNEYQAISHTFGPNSSPGDHLGILNSLWFNFAVICGQGADIMPKSSACVTLTGAWWGFLLLVISAYTANMTAFMTQVNSGGIKTLDELAGQQEFEYGIMHNSAMLKYFLPKAKDAPYTTIYGHLHEDEEEFIYNTQEEAFEKVLEGNFFLIAEYELAVDAMKQSCDFDVMGDGFYTYKFSLPFPKGSVYLPMFNDHINKLADKGVLAQLEEKWFTLEKNCETQDVVKNLENQLDIKAFIGMYVFLLLGTAGGVFICVLETGWIKCGGISGMFGRAGVYEFDTERNEIQKANELLEKEFESWDGGWKVWKFKEWNEGEENQLKSAAATPRPNSKMARCQVCGRGCKKRIGRVSKAEAPIISPPIVIHSAKEKRSDSSIDSGRESASSDLPLEKEDSTTTSDFSQVVEEEKSNVNNVEQDDNTISRESLPAPVILSEIPEPAPRQEIGFQVPSSFMKTNTTKMVVKADLHQQRIPFETLPAMPEERINSSLSAGSVSHSSLASGTLSFFSDSDESESTIHPRTPYENSPASSRFVESAMTYDWESSLPTRSSFYTDTSYDTESVYSRISDWSRSQRTPDTVVDAYTDDTRSDITVISRRFHRR